MKVAHGSNKHLAEDFVFAVLPEVGEHGDGNIA
jgi:hypothetical protein